MRQTYIVANGATQATIQSVEECATYCQTNNYSGITIDLQQDNCLVALTSGWGVQYAQNYTALYPCGMAFPLCVLLLT